MCCVNAAPAVSKLPLARPAPAASSRNNLFSSETRYINTKLNVSDVFTKDVSREVIEALGPMLTGRKPWPETPAADDAMKEHLAKALRENEILLKAMPKMNESLRALLE